MKLFYIILLLFYIIIKTTSCKQRNKTPVNDPKTRMIEIDSSANFNFQNSNIKDTFGVGDVYKYLNIKPIDSPKTIFEIRILSELPLSDSGRLIIIRQAEQKSICMVYRYKYIDEQNKLSMHYKVDTLTPLSGWEYFKNEIIKVNFLLFRDFHQIPGYSICTDPSQLSIDYWIQFKSIHREYPCFELNIQELDEKEINHLKYINSLLEKELGIKLFDLHIP